MLSVPTCARIPHRSFLSLTGVHATQFLNGIGRVLYDTFVYRQPSSQGHEDGFVIEYDSRPSAAPSLISLLKRYVLRSKVKVKDVSEQWDVWGIWGTETEPDDRKWRWSRSGAVEPTWGSETWPWGGDQDSFLLRDRRAYGMGSRRLIRKDDAPPEASNHNVTVSEAYTIHRISLGVPEGIMDIPPLQAFPMESNLDVMGAIDFRKGCYVGQELTVRTYHTGVVRKRILPVKIRPMATEEMMQATVFYPKLTPGLDIRPMSQAISDGKSRPRGTGKLLSSVGNVGLALLRLEHVEGVSRGLADFELEVDELNKQRWRVVHSWPTGWPVRGVDEIA
ncbi:Aminomethyltransferase folate-binding domain-containing protein [Ramaria rubella]|nr:Aminomethyltransferase folate-binding domain-containing protein [Ramaria rubella]